MTNSDEHRLAAEQQAGASRTAGPTLSVVVASNGSLSHLRACLTVVVPCCLRQGVELIVGRSDRPEVILELAAAYPSARLISAPPGTALPDLRVVGVSAASGDVVAVLGDTDARALAGGLLLDDLTKRCASAGDCAPERRLAPGSPTWPEYFAAHDELLDGDRARPRPHLQARADRPAHPYLSVIVPVHQDARVLARALEAVGRSDLSRECWELIVVDDASADESALIAARHTDVIVRLPGPAHGSAYARNRGADIARGECLVFVDADVRIQRDALRTFARIFAREPDVAAVFGSVDASAGGGFVSQYRNLLIAYSHEESPGDAETFWASCGAIRADAFAEAGRFDEWHFHRREVEVSELGHGLRLRGHRIELRPEIQATDLQQWTLRRLFATELKRTVLWMRILQKERRVSAPAGSRLRRAKRWNTALTWAALVLLLAALLGDARPPLFLSAFAVGVVMLNNQRQYQFLARRRSARFALAALPLDLLSYLVNGIALVHGWLLREFVGPPPPPPTVEAFAEVGVQVWPPIPARRPDAPAPLPTDDVEKER